MAGYTVIPYPASLSFSNFQALSLPSVLFSVLLTITDFLKDHGTAIWFANAVALSNALFTVVSLSLIDRVGRRKLLLIRYLKFSLSPPLSRPLIIKQ